MARVPRITSPCPLRWTSGPQPGKDYCGQCQRRVHNLDAMSSSQREAFLASCAGKVCVSYTVSLPRKLATLGAGLAGLLATGSAISNDWPTNSAPAPGEYCDPLRDEVIIVGGTNAGKELQWIDEEEAAIVRQDLPEIDASEWLPSAPDEPSIDSK